MSSDYIFAIVGILFLFLFAAMGGHAQYKRNKLIEECELSLPRTESCVLIAVPSPPSEED